MCTLIVIGFLASLIKKDILSFQSQATPTTSAANPKQIVVDNQVRPLPGKINNIPIFNSNSPEWIKKAGILLSTFPPENKKVPTAHLNYPFQGEFEIFAHHFTHEPPNLDTLYIGIIVHNPGTESITLKLPAAASYLMNPDAPFQQQPPMSENPQGEIYSGPGIRAVDHILRDIRQPDFPAELVINSRESKILLNHPIPVRGLERAVNGRSTFMRLESSGQVYVASLAMYAQKNADGSDRAPNLQEWEQLLTTGNLALPRDKTPTPPNQTSGVLIYGRVAGVQSGARWEATIVDRGESLKIPTPGEGFSYVINTLRGGTLGTGQVQAAKMLVRYPDTAYEAQANYGVHYDLTLPLINATAEVQTVALTLETPLKEEKLSQGGLIFRQPPWDYPLFRGTVRLRYQDDEGQEVTRYVHLWHRRGELLEALMKLKLAGGEKREVRIDFLYPPDSVPPQVLTVRTLD